jgi:hypothetical protein
MLSDDDRFALGDDLEMKGSAVITMSLHELR